MRVLITGKGGQLAWELEKLAPQNVELFCVCRAELDITDQQAVESVIADFKADIVINAAAYTAVDKAELDQEVAFAVNELGPENLALACKKSNIRLLHVSTDFVFSGNKATPYQPYDEPNPQGVYGASKLAGEIKIRDILNDEAVIVRTAWVYSVNGNNFVKTMLRLMKEKSELGVVYDQVGTPTWAKGLAEWLWSIALKPEVTGVYHWTDAGVASWYDFAVAVQELGIEKKLLNNPIPIRPIPSSVYPTPAKRPAFSVIDKSSAEEVAELSPRHWRCQLSLMLNELKRTY
jgi:dTDP-4-dehydrorhamnose reductase